MKRFKLFTVMLVCVSLLSSCAETKHLISGSIDVSASISQSIPDSEETYIETDKSSSENSLESSSQSSDKESSSLKEEAKPDQSSKTEKKQENSSSSDKKDNEKEEISASSEESKNDNLNSSESNASSTEKNPSPKPTFKKRKLIKYDFSEDDRELLPIEVLLRDNINNNSSESIPENPPVDEEIHSVSADDEMRAVWISYLDFYGLLQEKSENEFRRNIKSAFSKISNMGLNTVIVQVRPYSDALYYSDIFPMSYVVNGENKESLDPGFDPLEIMVNYAHDYNLKIEAWINPYRIRNANSKSEVSKENPAYSWIQNGDDAVLKYNGGYSYNPASKKAQKLIIKGVEEIVRNYDVDGIHFDDYFYPSTDMSIDEKSYNDYLKNGGILSQADFRRKNVNDLVKNVYRAIKNINPSVTFGISPQGNNSRNYNEQFADVDLWLSQSGYVDYICPQIYFGFNHSDCPFESTLKLWNSKITAQNVKLYVGISCYKVGIEDKWAGEGKNEWISSKNMMKRMVNTSRNCSNYGGFFLYRYDSLFNPAPQVKNHMEAEISNLKSIL